VNPVEFDEELSARARALIERADCGVGRHDLKLVADYLRSRPAPIDDEFPNPDPQPSELEAECGRLRAIIRALEGRITNPAPVPMLLWCPECRGRHVDEGEFATKPHHTHACQHCGHVWRPAIADTVGVRFLPGFKDTPS
jgi:hypothetical protein